MQGKLTKAQRKALAKAKQDEKLRQAKNDAKRKARLARVSACLLCVFSSRPWESSY